jgi:predicted nucleotidyltransferase
MRKSVVNSKIKEIKKTLESYPEITAARVYGSSLYDSYTNDIDIAILVPSDGGVVSGEIYSKLRKLRFILANELEIDPDLVPHTKDEFKDHNSPLYYPRYNPALVFGRTIKGEFPIVCTKDMCIKYHLADIAAYVLLDNRTITRRQLLRTVSPSTMRIFKAKLMHGPGNILTYLSIKNNEDYYANPSDVKRSFSFLNSIYEKFDVLKGYNNFMELERQIEINKISYSLLLKVINWYERLVAVTFGYK